MADKLDQILEIVQDVQSGQQRLESRMDGIDSRMDKLDSRIDKLDSRMDILESTMNNRFDKVEHELRVVREQTAQNAEIIPIVKKLSERVDSHEADIKLLKKVVTT